MLWNDPALVFRRKFAGRGIAALLCGLAVCGSAGALAAGKTEDFVISSFMTSAYNDAGNCPHGLNEAPDNKPVIDRVPDAELRAALSKALPEDVQYLRTHRGPDFADVCHLEAGVSNPDAPAGPTSVPDPGMKTVEGKISYGENLDGTDDGAATETTCAHRKFVGPNGEKGIDNQLFRVLGCSIGFGPQGWFREYSSQQMRDGDHTILVRVEGVDDPRNSPSVQVSIYEGADPLIKDPKGDILRDESYRASDDSRRRWSTTGRIADGVLTTDPIDITLTKLRFVGMQIPTAIKGMRLRLAVQPDGSAKGIMVGYQNWQDIYRLVTHGKNDELSFYFTCPGVYRALERSADGDKDPRTGQCRAVSVSYDLELMPAHVIAPPQPAGKTAQAVGKTAGLRDPGATRTAEASANDR
jgi:hypothetical protein